MQPNHYENSKSPRYLDQHSSAATNDPTVDQHHSPLFYTYNKHHQEPTHSPQSTNFKSEEAFQFQQEGIKTDNYFFDTRRNVHSRLNKESSAHKSSKNESYKFSTGTGS